MGGDSLVLAALAAPVIASALVPCFSRAPNVREAVSLTSAVALFFIVAALYLRVVQGAEPALRIAEPIPGLALAFRVEPLGVLFALIASFLWIVTTAYSIGYMRAHEECHQTRFYTCFAVAILGAIGVAFSANAFSLFVFYEVLTLSTYPLVTHAGTDEARQAGRIYLGVLLGTSIGAFLFALIWTWSIAGNLDFVAGGILDGRASSAVLSVLYTLYIVGIGKAAIMPFHRWLPAAMVAPTPVSALLHAVAVVKAGVFSILKITVYLFGVETVAGTMAWQVLPYVAAFTILAGSLVAMTKDNLKARLAYSTISQLSYVVLGALLANGKGIVGAGMHIAMHAFGKITLFFCAGAILVTAHKTKVSELAGMGRVMPITMFAFLIGSLCVIGLPPTGGTWSKWFLAIATLEANHQALLAVLMISSILSMTYLLPIPIRGFFFTPVPGQKDSIKEAPLPCLIALLISCVGCVTLFLYPEPLYRLVAMVVE